MVRAHASPIIDITSLSDDPAKRKGRRRKSTEGAAQIADWASLSPDDLGNAALYINRELSWLEFNRRVLAQASDPSHPLLERVKFLAISATNLDEFFMVRVATLLKKFRAGIDDVSIDGLSTDAAAGRDPRSRATNRWPNRRAAGASSCGRSWPPKASTSSSRPITRRPSTSGSTQYFETTVFPVLTPLAFDPGHPFPFISNLSMNLAVRVRHGGRTKFARVKVPGMLPRFVPLPAGLAPQAGTSFAVPRRRHPPQHQRAVPGHEVRRRAPVPRHPRHRHGDPGGRGRRPARDRSTAA